MYVTAPYIATGRAVHQAVVGVGIAPPPDSGRSWSDICLLWSKRARTGETGPDQPPPPSNLIPPGAQGGHAHLIWSNLAWTM